MHIESQIDLCEREREIHSQASFENETYANVIICSLINEAPGMESLPPHPDRMAEQSRPFAQRFISVSLDKPIGRHIAGTQISACVEGKIKPDEAVPSRLQWRDGKTK